MTWQAIKSLSTKWHKKKIGFSHFHCFSPLFSYDHIYSVIHIFDNSQTVLIPKQTLREHSLRPGKTNFLSHFLLQFHFCCQYNRKTNILHNKPKYQSIFLAACLAECAFYTLESVFKIKGNIWKYRKISSETNFLRFLYYFVYWHFQWGFVIREVENESVEGFKKRAPVF